MPNSVLSQIAAAVAALPRRRAGARPGPAWGTGRAYDAHRRSVNVRQRQQRVFEADIGPIPAIADRARRDAACASLRVFAETYLPGSFYKPWSGDHLKVLSRLEATAEGRGLYALAMPRGQGKSALARVAVLWAILSGRRRYAVLVAATGPKAHRHLATIRQTLEIPGSRLVEDFPEVCAPLVALGRVTQNQARQSHNGEYTLIERGADQVVLPTLRIDPRTDAYDGPVGSDGRTRSSGAILGGCGLTGAEVRGQYYQTQAGDLLRPDYVVLDDPQTRASAKSTTQTKDRLDIANGDVLGMAGPDRRIASVACVTVIYPDDLAAKLLDRETSPDWQGERFPLVYEWPDDEEAWDEYLDRRAAELRAGGDGSETTLWYGDRQEAMDAGAVVAWPERYFEDELSAVQHAFNWRQKMGRLFWSEMQQRPVVPDEGGVASPITREVVLAKGSGLGRGRAPAAAQHVTAMIDVGAKLLWWMVCAWDEAFGGYVLDYGAYPDQERTQFTNRDAKRTLKRVHQGVGLEAAILAGLETLIDDLFKRPWRRPDGTAMPLDRVLVDTGYKPDTVELAIQRLGRGGALWPSRGLPVGPTNKPFAEYEKRRGDVVGHYWRIPGRSGRRSLRPIQFDSNYWKGYVAGALASAAGDAGSLYVWGTPPARQHDLLADHLMAEKPVAVTAKGRTVDVWEQPPAKPDNHWLDCLVGCAVAACHAGLVPPGVEAPPRRRRERKTLAEMRDASRRGG